MPSAMMPIYKSTPLTDTTGPVAYLEITGYPVVFPIQSLHIDVSHEPNDRDPENSDSLWINIALKGVTLESSSGPTLFGSGSYRNLTEFVRAFSRVVLGLNTRYSTPYAFESWLPISHPNGNHENEDEGPIFDTSITVERSEQHIAIWSSVNDGTPDKTIWGLFLPIDQAACANLCAAFHKYSEERNKAQR